MVLNGLRLQNMLQHCLFCGARKGMAFTAAQVYRFTCGNTALKKSKKLRLKTVCSLPSTLL